MKKTAIFLMQIAIVSKILGFGREIILSYFYGTSYVSDAYIVSLTIPTVIFSFLMSGISTGYIPMFSEIDKEYGEVRGQYYTNNILNLLMVLCTGLVILSLMFTPQIVKLFASGFKGETFLIAVKFTRISLFGVYFTGIISILTGFLQIKGRYIVAALLGLPLNIIIVLSVFLSSNIDVSLLPIGNIIGLVFQLILLMPFVRKEGYRYKFVFNLKDDSIKKMGRLVLPVIIGASVNQINLLIDRTLASIITIGGISALNYANKLNAFVQGIFVASISTVMYPNISKMVAENDSGGLKKSLSESINLINILVIPTTIGVLIFSEPIIRMIFGRGAFDYSGINMTSNALFFYSIGMVGYGLREVLAKSFYALHDTKTPMINGTIGVIINIVLNIVLSKYMGIGGLALATSVSAIFTTISLFISLRKKIGHFGIKQISITFIKSLFASLFMGILAKLCFDYLSTILSYNFSLIISIVIGAVSYFVIIYFMKIEDINVIVEGIKKKIVKSVS